MVRGTGARACRYRESMLQTPETHAPRRLMRKLKLRKVSPAALTVERRKIGDNEFDYYLDGERVTDAELLDRFRALAVPPAYSEVRFALDPQAHIQAIGRDDAGRLQYRYHPE